MKYIIAPLLFALQSINAQAQSGCTDPLATNYSPTATVNNGSCVYPTTNISVSHSKTLPAAINETSGLIYTSGKLWTIADSGNPPLLFRIDSATGAILQTVTVTNATNVDWEDLAADDNYIYIGDFGNNAEGNRSNLRIYRIAKADIGSGSTVNVTAGIINFTYQDQTVGAPTENSNSTNYDCEAFVVKDNTLHLFSKDWLDGQTRHYTLSSTPGSHVAVPIETLNVSGLITAADISSHNDIVLLGYTSNYLNIFMYLLYDYSGNHFFSGNKRRIGLGTVFTVGQAEGITFVNNTEGYISNETRAGIPPMLHSFVISSMLALPVKLNQFRAAYKNPEVQLSWQTASEINSDFFSVERSADAINFKEIGRKDAAGHSEADIDYHFTDWTPAEGINYYRLKQVDNDGGSALSEIKTIKTAVNVSGKFRVYLPGASRLVIDSGQPPALKTTYQLISITGVMLQEGQLLVQKQAVDIKGLAKGQYIVRLSDGRSVQFARN